MTRTLTKSEIGLLLPIGDAFTAEASYPGGFSLPAFRAIWETILDADLGSLWVSEVDGKVIAALGAVFVPDTFSGRPTALEQFWFVMSEHRSGRAGLELFQAFEAEAISRKSEKVVMVHLANLNSELMTRFYRKHGYSLVEQNFWKQL